MRWITQDEMDEFRKASKHMNYDKIKKLWEEMMDVDLTKMSYSTFSNVPLPPMDDDMVDKIKKNYMPPTTPPVQQRTYSKSYAHGGAYPGISPTDKDAKGTYPYQEPEQDEQGTFYGYKILHLSNMRQRGCNCQDCISLVSPRYPAKWIDGQLKADHEPSERSMFGIHCTKRPDHPELNNYQGQFQGYTVSPSGCWVDESWVLVRCALGGTVVETEQGFRAEFAKIVGVYQDGNWKSYQDYSERANANSRRTPEVTVTYEDWQRRSGYWKTYTNLDPGSIP